MFKFFKKLLHSVEPNTDNNLSPPLRMIYEVIRKNPDPYDEKFKGLKLDVIEPDIGRSYNLLKNYNNTDFESVRISNRPFNNGETKSIRFLEWYSRDKYLIEKTVLRAWLLQAETFLYRFEVYSSNMSGITYGNCIIVKPYYDEISGIVESIHSLVK